MDGLVEPLSRPLADRVHFQRQQPQQPVEWARKPLGGSCYGGWGCGWDVGRDWQGGCNPKLFQISLAETPHPLR